MHKEANHKMSFLMLKLAVLIHIVCQIIIVEIIYNHGDIYAFGHTETNDR